MTNNLKWYVLAHDFNTDEIVSFNIFNSISFTRRLECEIKHYKDFETFKEGLRGALFSVFASRVEYEIICSGVVSLHDNEEKIDVYQQVLPNLDILANYIINEAINK